MVTLVENPRASVLGVAYPLLAKDSARILAELDERERAGYESVAHSTNEQIAEIVRVARGPSGKMQSYVRRLARSLRELGEDDPHVAAIARLLDEKHSIARQLRAAPRARPRSIRGVRMHGLTRYQWFVLFAAWLGWGFDVFAGLLFN